MRYIINPSKWNRAFAVPCEVVDSHIRLAGSVQLKVLLWLMRHSADEKNVEDMARDIGVSAPDCLDALTYWNEMGILVDEGESVNIVPDGKVREEIIENKEVGVIEKANEKKNLPDIEAVKPTVEQIVARGDESEEIRFLFNEAQTRMGKTIGHDGQAVLLMMHDAYGLPVEVIVTIIEYCVSVGKTSTAYISKIGKDWGEREIDTLEKADEMINELKTADKVWKEFCTRTGISTPRATQSQMKYLNRWLNEYRFSMDMVILSYEEAANNIQKISFQYMDKVLKNWFEEGLTTPMQVLKAKEDRKNTLLSKKETSQKAVRKKSSYNIDEILKENEETELVYKRKGGND